MTVSGAWDSMQDSEPTIHGALDIALGLSSQLSRRSGSHSKFLLLSVTPAAARFLMEI